MVVTSNFYFILFLFYFIFNFFGNEVFPFGLSPQKPKENKESTTTLEVPQNRNFYLKM
jgi:hypothetical protein